MINNPLVSVVIPVNKHNPFLKEAIESIQNQSYSNIEIILIANNCSDCFFNSLQEFSNEKTKLIRTDLSFLPFSLNLGIHIANGEFIARMDSDDIADVDRIAKQVVYMRAHSDVAVVGSNVKFIDERGIITGMSDYPISHRNIKRRMRYNCCVAHPSVMMRRDVIVKAGGYMYGSLSEDYDLWLRLLQDKNVVFHNINEPLLQYRIHANQATGKNNLYKIFIYDLCLKLRFFLLYPNVFYFFGCIRGFLSYIYCRYIKK
ncbi:glycosyltransferase [Pectobacterium parmentieri]|uniref:glycosyltransferase n=1 Tax=Pectobacterium parmentieri TaxID=1905730 RepID=UPI0009DF4734|nr:glycosyltransferase [Pectobacterium parmentieri]AYH06445.1 glycosyl transferase [Pectobacterium parmentieri]AYH23962.1 glycosyl transferase [Pectobacterium parmentieri]MBN3176812.1 glycosyltransferase [Pectobacterium parmentieri]